jgi:hypothetical protein
MVDMELQSRLLQHVVDQVLPASIESVIGAFEARALSLYAASVSE